MENRFGIKDFFLFLLLIVLIVSVWLAMKQFDRQYEVIRDVNNKLDSQTRDLQEVRRAIETGAVAQATTRPADQRVENGNDPFARIRAAKELPNFAEGGWYIDAFTGVAKLTPLVSGDVYASIVQSSVLETL